VKRRARQAGRLGSYALNKIHVEKCADELLSRGSTISETRPAVKTLSAGDVFWKRA